MNFADLRQTLTRDFMRSAAAGRVPPLETYFHDFVRSDAPLTPGDFRLRPLTPPCLRMLYTSSNCLTDCMLELQARYRQVVPSAWGGHLQKGWRDLGVIGFNFLDGPELEIVEINPADGFHDWAQPMLQGLAWEQLLIHAVLDFCQAWQARRVLLQPAKNYPLGSDAPREPTRLTEVKEGLAQRYDGSARAMGFGWDETRDRFVWTPTANQPVSATGA